MKNNRPILSAIAAMSQNRVIGINNQLPWHLPDDLQHFKTLTTGKPIIMGRKTHESIGRALPNRTNYVLTRDKGYQAAGCVVVNDIDEALAAIDQDEVFIIGGANVYEKCLPQIQRIYLTIVHAVVEGDVFFPALSDEWQEIERVEHAADDRHVYAFSFVTLVRC